MILDQGFWPEGYLTAPSDEALQTDIGWIKMFGFNGVRKHQKIEDPRWLYWCDRLGLLVWEEMPNAREWSPKAEDLLSAEWQDAVRRDYNHPCIVAWVPVNESMGFPGLSHGACGAICVHRTDGAGHEAARFHAARDRQRWLGTYRHHRHLRDSRLHPDRGKTFAVDIKRC